MSDALEKLVEGGQAIVRIENESLQQVAVQRPRPPVNEILKEALAEIEAVPEFAGSAFYSIPYRERKGEGKTVKVEGPTIKAANQLQRMYRNISSGGRPTGEDKEYIYVQGVGIDLETNTRIVIESKVAKVAFNKSTGQYYDLSPDRLIMAVKAEISKARRNAVIDLLPASLVLPFVQRAKQLAAGMFDRPGQVKASPAERWKVAVDTFKSTWDVTEAQILEKLEMKSAKEITDEKIGDLVGLFNALKEKLVTKEEAFPTTAKKSEGESTTDALFGEEGKAKK
jgi:hypothetical protein